VKLIFYEDLIMAPLNGTAGVLSFLAHRGSAPTQASAPAPLSSLAVASAAAAWGGVDSAAVWDLRAAAALVRAANICDPHTAEWYVDARSSLEVSRWRARHHHYHHARANPHLTYCPLDP